MSPWQALFGCHGTIPALLEGATTGLLSGAGGSWKKRPAVERLSGRQSEKIHIYFPICANYLGFRSYHLGVAKHFYSFAEQVIGQREAQRLPPAS